MIKGVIHKVHHSGYGEEVPQGEGMHQKKKKMTSPIQKNFTHFFFNLVFAPQYPIGLWITVSNNNTSMKLSVRLIYS